LWKLRRDERSEVRFAPVIVLTAHTEKGKVLAARDAGATEFCRKPITVTELMSKLARVIDSPRGFVESPAYAGPDRRRKAGETYSGPERRAHRV